MRSWECITIGTTDFPFVFDEYKKPVPSKGEGEADMIIIHTDPTCSVAEIPESFGIVFFKEWPFATSSALGG